MSWADVRRMVDGFEAAGWEAVDYRGFSGDAGTQEWSLRMYRPDLADPGSVMVGELTRLRAFLTAADAMAPHRPDLDEVRRMLGAAEDSPARTIAEFWAAYDATRAPQ